MPCAEETAIEGYFCGGSERAYFSNFIRYQLFHSVGRQVEMRRRTIPRYRN
jgi:hypothetical protein